MATFDEQLSKAQTDLARGVDEVDFEYDYPEPLRGKDGKPGSPKHDWIVNEINQRVRCAQAVINPVIPEWREVDYVLNAFVRPDDAEVASNKDPSKPISVVVPTTFTNLELFQTYMTSVFLRPPIHQLDGVGSPEAIIQGAKLEMVLAAQDAWFKKSLRLMSQWRSAFAYGVGIIMPTWSKHKAKVTNTVPVDPVLSVLLKEEGIDASPGDVIRFPEEKVLFEGSECVNVDTYRYLCDPDWSGTDVQKAGFVGFQTRTNAMNLLDRESDPESRTFNARYVRLQANGGGSKSIYWQDDSGRNSRQGLDSIGDVIPSPPSEPVDITKMWIKIIPREWALSDVDTMEIWEFAVAGDKILVQAHPLDLDHGMFPVSVYSPNTSGHEPLPVSHLMTTLGLQEYGDWLWSSRRMNARISMNAQTVVDPEYFFASDVLEPRPGKIIRMKRRAFGRDDPRNHIFQLPVQDVTFNHPRDAALVQGMMNEALGTTDLVRGDFSGLPERPTTGGIQAAARTSFGRMQYWAQIYSEQSLRDIGFQSAYNTIQFMDQDMYVPLVGDHEQLLREEFGVPNSVGSVPVSPFDISPNFQIRQGDGAQPIIDNPEIWQFLLQTLSQAPGFAQELAAVSNPVAIMKHLAKMSGARNVEQFIQGGGANVQTVPDDQVRNQAQAGNLVPLGDVA